LGTHYHIRNAYLSKIHLKYTNKQSLRRKGVASPLTKITAGTTYTYPPWKV